MAPTASSADFLGVAQIARENDKIGKLLGRALADGVTAGFVARRPPPIAFGDVRGD
jgi:hypothetical protein